MIVPVLKYTLIVLSSILGSITVIVFTMVAISNPGFYNTGNYDEEKEKDSKNSLII
jgi:hypothetical protein